MADVLQLDINAGVPTSGTGQVATINALMALVGALNNTAVNDPAVASATLLQLLRGILNLGKSEDTAHSSGDRGIPLLAVRNDAGGSLVAATGNYGVPQLNSLGQLIVDAPQLLAAINAQTVPLSSNWGTTATVAGGTSADISPTPAAGVRAYISSLIIGTRGATIPADFTVTSGSTSHYVGCVPPDGSIVVPLPDRLRGEVATKWTITAHASTTFKASAAGFLSNAA